MNKTVWIAPLAALLLTACGGDDNNDSDAAATLTAVRSLPVGDDTCAGGGQVTETGVDRNGNGSLEATEVTTQEFQQCLTAPRLRALHASPDAPPVNISVNGTQALGNVDYAQGSGFLPVATASHVQVEAIIPGGNAVVIDENLSLAYSTDYTVIAVGQVAAPVGALIISNPTAPIAAGKARAQVVHAAPGAPPVDVYVTAPGASLAGSTAVNDSPLAYQQYTGRAELPAGSYQIRVTLAGDASAVVFTSGTLNVVAGADLLFAAVPNTGPGPSPIRLVALDGQRATTVLDAGTPASIVAVHASPDAPAVDLLADDQSTTGVESLALARNVAFPAACRISAVPAPGNYGVSVTAAGNPSVVALQFDLAPRKADVVTAIVTGYLGGTPAIQPLALATSERSVVTEARLRVTHASPGTGPVDLYLLPDGASLAAATPSFAAVPFGADTGQLSIAPGVYDVYVTPAGNPGVVAIEAQNLALTGGQVLDVIARDAKPNGSEGALPQLIVVDHATVTACAS